MLKGLEGKTALVTGASGEIGRAACARLLAEGANVIGLDLNQSALDTHLDARVVKVAGSVSDPQAVAAAVDAAIEQFGGLDLAFLNAGVECRAAPVVDFSEREYERVFDVNVRGIFLCAQAVVRHLLDSDKPGALLLMASIAGLQGSPNTAIYNASKHAVIGLGKSLALEVGSKGIRVNMICPGTIDTRMMHSLEETMGAASGIDARDMHNMMAAGNALGRYGTAEEIASMAVWALSDEAPYCHGETLTISGGLTA
ncbi:SDR family NAD(P)-dependent oxidoreductase [Haliea sp. E17]|uniref:SDR family NAD(P)-dependent oxidoreductase n=1 Tax=Haliea sp. E17 TaxID=3401576 RepID=UPI003AAACA05